MYSQLETSIGPRLYSAIECGDGYTTENQWIVRGVVCGVYLNIVSEDTRNPSS